jgi:hypothetical protein
MKRSSLILLSSNLLLLLLASVVFAGSSISSHARTTRQGVMPTSTFYPVPDDFTFSLERVAMTADPIIFDDQEVDGFHFTNFTYTTRYPFGLDFTVTITPPPDVEVLSVNLVYRFPAGTQSRARARQHNGNENDWQAVPYDTRGLAPWMPMSVFWRVSHGRDGVAETQPVNVIYIDPTREWWRAESEDAIVYWFNFPQELGQVVMEAFVHVRDRYRQGFGGLLPFKPTVLIFPPGDVMGEWQAGGQINPRTTGQANGETYSAVLRVRGLEIEEIRKDCVWNEPRDLAWQMQFAASVATHEVAHLYQYAFFGGLGPAWWIEGQATFFEIDMGPVDQRLQRLASLGEDLPTLQGSGPSGMVSTPASDGCTHLGYDMGASFINWLVNTQGGFDMHRRIVELTKTGYILTDAIEHATGVPFLELERQWRTYIGLAPEPFIPPTLEYQFPPSPTPFGQ